jgi:multiple antibiotic resistance protein
MFFQNFLLVFVPIFVAVDAMGILPLFLGLTEGMERRDRQRTIKQAVLTALAVAIGFVFLGKSIFQLMGITVYDFMVAGGLLLFLIAMTDLLSGAKLARRVETVGAVPLGVPLIVGPGVLTTGLMLVDVHGIAATISAMAINILIAGAVFMTADFWMRILGQAGSQAISKVASLLLAAIAVMMIRRGLIVIITGADLAG